MEKDLLYYKMKKEFTETFCFNKWHMGQEETRSGLGSTISYSKNFSDNLIKIIERFNIKSIFDCSCGDWNWMKNVPQKFDYYLGNDIVEEVIDFNRIKYGNEKINFTSGDMLSSLINFKFKQFDLIICRHTFEHLNNDYILESIKEIIRVSNYCIITSTRSNCENENMDIEFDGHNSRAINLLKNPFFEFLGNPSSVFIDTLVDSLADREDINQNTCFGHFYNFNLRYS